MISQTEMARRLGVSQTAVSVALRHRERELRLDPALAGRIRSLGRRLGYSPNLLARSLAQKRTHTLGVVVSDFSDPTFGGLLNHLQDRALRSNHELMVVGCGDRMSETHRIWERLLQRRVDAVLWIDRPPHASLSVLKRLWKQANIAVIGIGTAFRKAGIPSVVFDSEDAVCQLARHFPAQKRSPVVFLQSNPKEEFSSWRWQCVRAAWGSQARALKLHARFEAHDLVRFRRKGQPLILIGDQDLASLTVLHRLLAAGWLPRHDFLLGSFDGLPWLERLSPRLASVRQPLERMSDRAVELALSPSPANKIHRIPGALIRGDTL